jgi:hypothetical protein
MNTTAIEQLAYISVAQVVQDVGSEGRGLPPGCQGRLSAAIDRLRMVAAPAEHILIANDMSLKMHLLEGAIRQRDEAAAADLRGSIQALGAQWVVPA